jgi:hypothetical protein
LFICQFQYPFIYNISIINPTEEIYHILEQQRTTQTCEKNTSIVLGGGRFGDTSLLPLMIIVVIAI